MTTEQTPESWPQYGRSCATGRVLTVSGGEGSAAETDRSIPGGWPMVNHGRGWAQDRTPERIGYSPHPTVPEDHEITQRILRRILDDARAGLDGSDAAAAAAYPEENSLQFVFKAGRIEETLQLLLNRLEPYAAPAARP